MSKTTQPTRKRRDPATKFDSMFDNDERDRNSKSARARSRVAAKNKLRESGNIINGREATSSDLWLEELRLIDTDTDETRGEAVLSASSAILNVKSYNIADFLRVLLKSDAWRSFTYPNGDHYEFREREFDYFCAHIDLDPRLATEATRLVGDQKLLVAMAEASLAPGHWNPHDEEREGVRQPDRSKRRSIDEIIATYPRLEKWLKKYGYAHTLGGRALHASATVRQAYRKGKSLDEAKGRRQFKVNAGPETDLAELIATRLVEKGLADDVRKHLNAITARERRAASRNTRKAKK